MGQKQPKAPLKPAVHNSLKITDAEMEVHLDPRAEQHAQRTQPQDGADGTRYDAAGSAARPAGGRSRQPRSAIAERLKIHYTPKHGTR